MPCPARSHHDCPASMNENHWHEIPGCFDCEGQRLVGIVAKPEEPVDTGVIIIVGGPQYRAGSHRQFTLLARQLARQGVASMRFDYRGMGDSEGGMRNFEHIDDDVRAATDALITKVPELRRIVLWGLCDAASAALYYAPTDDRVSGLVLLNPWVHSTAGAAKARLKHYYLRRLMQRSFWEKLLSGKVKVGNSVRDIAGATDSAQDASSVDPRHGSPGYINRMLQGLKSFKGDTLVILSAKDLVAQAFRQVVASDRNWKNTCRNRNVTQEILPDANHTCSSKEWRSKVERLTNGWIERAGATKKSC